MGWIFFGIVTAVWAALMVVMFAKRKKAADETGKRKAKIGLALVMPIPTVGAGFFGAMMSTSW